MILDFSWICFSELDPFICVANLDNEHISNLLQTSLLSARVEDECDPQINGNLYKQIEELRNKMFDSKKRIQSLNTNKIKITNEQLNKNSVRANQHSATSTMKTNSSKRKYTFIVLYFETLSNFYY